METMEQRVEVFDVGRALNSVGDDREFLSEFVGIIQAAWPTLLADIRRGLGEMDLHAVRTTARLATAAAQYLSAKRTYEAARQVETIAGKEDWKGAREAVANLEREVETLQIFLASLDDLGQPSGG